MNIADNVMLIYQRTKLTDVPLFILRVYVVTYIETSNIDVFDIKIKTPCRVLVMSPVAEWSTQRSFIRDHQYTAQGMFKTSSYAHTNTYTYTHTHTHTHTHISK